MIRLPSKLSACTLGLTALTASSFASEKMVVLQDPMGLQYEMIVDSKASFDEVMSQISETILCLQASEESENIPSQFKMNVKEGQITVKAVAKKVEKGASRNYAAPLTQSEVADISYIVTTLANESLVKLKGKESAIKKAGDRVEHVHPLKFLYCVFSNEELKVGIRNIQGRSWVGKSFMEGLTTSLKKENGLGNLLPHAQDFANTLNIDVNIIMPSLKAGQYDKFVDLLIKTIPRSGDSGRYDM